MNAVAEEVTLSQLELMVSTNNVAVDVIPVSAYMDALASVKGYLEKIDYSIYRQDELDAILDFTESAVQRRFDRFFPVHGL